MIIVYHHATSAAAELIRLVAIQDKLVRLYERKLLPTEAGAAEVAFTVYLNSTIASLEPFEVRDATMPCRAWSIPLVEFRPIFSRLTEAPPPRWMQP